MTPKRKQSIMSVRSTIIITIHMFDQNFPPGGSLLKMSPLPQVEKLRYDPFSMRIPRVYHPSIKTGDELHLSANASNHVLRVLRLKPQAPLRLFDGKGAEFEGIILESRKGVAVVQVQNSLDIQMESPLRIHLGQGISRGEKMDFVIQKAIELGVNKITPLFTQRCEVKLSTERSNQRLQHWRSVAIHACEQSGRNVLPDIEPPQTLQTWLKQRSEPLRLVFQPQSEKGLRDLPTPVTDVVILIGPEGGLSAEEIQWAQLQDFQILHLGPRTLRTETAALAAIAALQSSWGDLSHFPSPARRERVG